MSKKKKPGKKGPKLTSSQLQSEIFKLFKNNPKRRYNPRQIASKLKISNNKDSIQHAMEQLARDNKLVDLGDYKFQVKGSAMPRNARSNKQVEGIVDMTASGAAYIVSDEMEDDVRVDPSRLNTALNGDKVLIRVWTPGRGGRPKGEVVKVLKRANSHFIGIYWKYDHYGLVAPDGNMPHDIMVKADDEKGAQDGEKVVVEITDWTRGKHPQPQGRVTTVLGEPGSHDIEMKSILVKNGFDLEFPDAVIRESEKLDAGITEEEVAKRRDMRKVTTFTIDPATARDFDDALSIRWLDNGHIEIGIHIADVSHYVQEGTALDKEAYDRSTSVYLVDRVLPMLPERLSNELCSLRPHEEKLTFSAVFEFDKDAQIRGQWIGRTVIYSDHRFAYEEAQEVIEGGKGPYHQELRQLNKLAKQLRKRRFRAGAINFDSQEVQFVLDEEGVPVEVFVKERKDAHLLVEDFMLLANRKVAEYIDQKSGGGAEIPFVYRIHDEPDPDKVAELARFAKAFGFTINMQSPEQIARSYNELIKASENDPQLKVLAPLAIRTMAKAAYSTENIGHYGLGFSFYTHFTSPIRRYSDVLVHRILDKNLTKGQVHRVKKGPLEEQCRHISQMERRAQDAERESVKYKQVEYMEKHLGDEFEGVISGMIERGFFVEILPTFVEGMVAFDQMKEGHELMPGGLSFKGQRSGTEYKMGDRVKVKVINTDLSRRRLDLGFVAKLDAPEKTKKRVAEKK